MKTEEKLRAALGQRIREERVRLGLTQEEFGKLSNTLRATQAQYEKGIREPKASYFLALMEHQVNVSFMLFGERDDKKSSHDSEFVEAEKFAFKLLIESLQALNYEIKSVSPEGLHLAFVNLRNQAMGILSKQIEDQKRA